MSATTPRITLAMLKGACSEQRHTFLTEWPQGAVATLENVQRAQAIGLNLDWGTCWFTATAYAEYESVRIAAQAEYRLVTIAALAEYQRVRIAANVEYQRVRIAAWLKYESVTAAAQAEYESVRIAAQAEYESVTAAAWLAAFLTSQAQAVQG
jgi:hypothetical protein